jgi:hypothetical protein
MKMEKYGDIYWNKKEREKEKLVRLIEKKKKIDEWERRDSIKQNRFDIKFFNKAQSALESLNKLENSSNRSYYSYDRRKKAIKNVFKILRKKLDQAEQSFARRYRIKKPRIPLIDINDILEDTKTYKKK